VKTLVSIDFLSVPTLRFQILYIFVVLAHDRRRILHFAVMAHPTSEWTAQQLREAFPQDSAPRFLLRDRDCNFILDRMQRDFEPMRKQLELWRQAELTDVTAR
jgi:hypothetical protein